MENVGLFNRERNRDLLILIGILRYDKTLDTMGVLIDMRACEFCAICKITTNSVEDDLTHVQLAHNLISK